MLLLLPSLQAGVSVDIIKSGGFKLSALEIESLFLQVPPLSPTILMFVQHLNRKAILQHPGIEECAVIGLPDDAYGEKVVLVASLVDKENDLTLEALQSWATDKLAAYKVGYNCFLDFVS